MDWIKGKQEETVGSLCDELYDMFYKRYGDLAKKYNEEIVELCEKVRDSGINGLHLYKEVIDKKVIPDLIKYWRYHTGSYWTTISKKF